MKTFLSLMIATLYPFVKCTQDCGCRSLRDILLDDINFNIFRNPWPFLRSAERLYLKYVPHKYSKEVSCVISDLIRNDSSSYFVERTVSWTNLSMGPPTRDTVDVEIQGSPKSETEFTVTQGYTEYDFNTVYADPKCLIIKISRSTGLERECLLWVKEKYLGNPLRHCSFLYYLFCNWKSADLNPKKGCDEKIKKKDKNTAGGQSQPGAPRPPR
uniref:Putative salivary lipocalin n=1 Tax=Ixodes ricinus TaxID=34613 RepID=A0A0K8R846_IXORI